MITWGLKKGARPPGATRKELTNAHYISLLKFTQKGLETIKEAPKRLDAAKQRFREAGAEIKAWYLVMGEYDAVAIVEAPNDETVARLSLTTAAMG